MSEVKRWSAMYYPLGNLASPEAATMVFASDYDAKAAECERLREENARLAIDISEITKAAEVWLRRRNEIASQRDRLEVECDRLRKAVHDLQLFVQDSRGLKIIADALSPTEGAGAALPEGKP